MMKDIDAYISRLDTGRFGFPVAKVNDFGSDPAGLVGELSDAGVKLVISKVDASDISLINFLESEGFRLKDTQVTYAYYPGKSPLPVLPDTDNDVLIRRFIPEDMPGIDLLLRHSFEEYGHYFADKNLNREKCMEIYPDWGRRSCTDPQLADLVLVAQAGSKIAGMLSFKKYDLQGKKYAAGGLGAVDASFRGKNIFKGLALGGLEWSVAENLHWVEHNVLTTNFPVNRVFSSLGFRIIHSFVTMHAWLQKNRESC